MTERRFHDSESRATIGSIPRSTLRYLMRFQCRLTASVSYCYHSFTRLGIMRSVSIDIMCYAIELTVGGRHDDKRYE